MARGRMAMDALGKLGNLIKGDLTNTQLATRLAPDALFGVMAAAQTGTGKTAAFALPIPSPCTKSCNSVWFIPCHQLGGSILKSCAWILKEIRFKQNKETKKET